MFNLTSIVLGLLGLGFLAIYINPSSSSKKWTTTSEGWEIRYDNTECMALSPFNKISGIMVSIEYDGKMAVTLRHGNWNLSTDMIEPISFKFDNNPNAIFTVRGRKVGDMIIVLSPYNESFVRHVADSHNLSVEMSGSRWSHNVTGAKLAMEHLMLCARFHGATL